jgi:hypothetical protein
MGFSAIIATPLHDSANATLEAAGFGPGNFSVALWMGSDPAPMSFGLNGAAENPAFRAAVAAIPNVSIRDAAPEATEFDQHVESLGLSREPPPV